MGALHQISAPTRLTADINAIEAGGLAELCAIDYESGERHYKVTLAADVSSIALEGMKQFRIDFQSTHKESGIVESMSTVLEINIREAMNYISIEGDEPLYFTITRKSLNILDEEIDSSIHEVVDLGLMELRIDAGARNKKGKHATLLFDLVAANLLKSCVSTLLAQATQCHRQVIHEADHLFASRQDYVREMCRCLGRNAEGMAASVTSKALYCDQGIF